MDDLPPLQGPGATAAEPSFDSFGSLTNTTPVLTTPLTALTPSTTYNSYATPDLYEKVAKLEESYTKLIDMITDVTRVSEIFYTTAVLY